MKKLTTLILALLLVLTFAGCEKEDIIVTSSDENYTVTAPGEYKDVQGELNSSAIIELADFKNDTYLAIIPYPLELFPTLADFAVNITQSVPKWYPDAQVQEPATYKYDTATYYKLYSFVQGENSLALKFNMINDEQNYFLAISYTTLDDEYKSRLDVTDAIIHSMAPAEPSVPDTVPDEMQQDPPQDDPSQNQDADTTM